MPTLAAPLDFAKLEGRNFQAHQLGTAPGSPVKGQLYYNTGDNTLYWYDGTTWQSAKSGSGGAAGGDLTGTYPNPTIAPGVVTDTKVAAANKDGAAATPSMRTWGTGAAQAAAGNDSRLSDSRTPTAHKTTHEPGGSDPMTVDAAAGTGSLRTLGLTGSKAMPGTTTLDAVTAPAADVNLNSKKITNLLDPASAQDAATKAYVDATAQGLDAKQSVACVATSTIGGGSGPAAGLPTIDGYTVVNGDRVLLTAQTNPAFNGIWIANSSVSWSRASDMDSFAEFPSAYTWVEQGTTYGDTGWVCTNNPGGTLNSTNVTWTQFSSATQIAAGAGLTKTGSTIDLATIAGGGLTIAADSVVVDSTVARYYSSATHAAGASFTITQATHGCRASRGLVVMTVVEATGAEVLADVSIAANGDVTITFGASQSANTIRVTIIG